MSDAQREWDGEDALLRIEQIRSLTESRDELEAELLEAQRRVKSLKYRLKVLGWDLRVLVNARNLPEPKHPKKEGA